MTYGRIAGGQFVASQEPEQILSNCAALARTGVTVAEAELAVFDMRLKLREGLRAKDTH